MAGPETKTALVIGAPRGLGLAIAREFVKRGWNVVATQRAADRMKLQEAAAASEGRLGIATLDVTDQASPAGLQTRLSHTRLALLFVAAGVADGSGHRVDRITDEKFIRTMLTNALGPMRVIAAAEDRVSLDGTIAVMSSSLGSIPLNGKGTWEVYRASKAALNTLMRSYAARQGGQGCSLALVDPGFVRTDMGGPDATLSIDESIPGVVDALLARAGRSGLQYLDCKD